MIVLTGIKGLLRSTKGTLCLIFVACATYGLFKSNIDAGIFAAYGGIISTIAGMYMWTRSKANLAKIEQNNE